MATEIILYDLPTKNPVSCWSPNTWKTRVLLNLKGATYSTKWTEYPDVKPLLESKLPPNQKGLPYTCPTIQLSDEEWIMDSMKIARRVEELFPEPSVDLGSGLVEEVDALSTKIMITIMPDFLQKVPRRFLSPGSIPFWHQTRQEWYDGMTLEDIEIEHGGDQVYKAAEPDLQRILTLLKKNSDGPFFEGQRLTYADIAWVSLLRFYEKLGDDVLSKLISLDPQPHRALLDACRGLLERDSY